MENNKPNNDVKNTNLPSWYVPVSVAVGIVLIFTLLGLAVFVPSPTPTQFFIFRVILALSAAAFGATIPGFLKVNLPIWGKGALAAGGALALFIVIYQLNPPAVDNGNKQTQAITLKDLSIYTIAEKAKFLSRREVQLLLNMKTNTQYALAAVNNKQTGMRFPSTEELKAYKTLEKHGYVRFNQDVNVLERFIKGHGFKIDDFSYKGEDGYADSYNYDSPQKIPPNIAQDIQRLAVKVTPSGKLFKEQLIKALIDDFLSLKQQELEGSQ